MTLNYRTYGEKPFNIAVIHGGPGAAGEMACVAYELSKSYGILEPLQTADSLEGQIEELSQTLTNYANIPVILIGFSWGAMLSFIVAARCPSLVKKLIMIGSGPLEKNNDTKSIRATRMKRLTKTNQRHFKSLWQLLQNPSTQDKDLIFADIGNLLLKCDAYDLLPNHKTLTCDCNYHIFSTVWPEVETIRNSEELINLRNFIHCPLTVIHGDYDPHPAASLQNSLANVIKDFKFIVLKKCGHCPWIEKHAKDIFYDILNKEIQYF